MTAIARRLPFGLARIVPPSLVGFAVINGFTFTCDLALLTVLHGVLHWPVPAGITVSYGTASGLSYLLNRTFAGAGLAALGVGYQIVRGIAAMCEAVYMYTAMRWVVFRDATPEPEPQQPEPGARRGQSGAGPGHDDVAVAVDHAVTRPEQ